VRRADGRNYMADRATIRVDGRYTVSPERRFYPAADQTTREVGLRSDWRGDLYVSVGEARLREDGAMVYELRAAYHPLVWMLGFGAFLVVSGGGLALSGRLMSGAPARVRRETPEPSAAAAPVDAAEAGA